MKTKKLRERIQIALPDGVTVAQRPANLELLARTKNKWIGIIQQLETLEATKCLIIDLGGLLDVPGINSKNKIAGIKSGIKATAKFMKHTKDIKFAEQNGKLYVWSN